MKRYSFGIAGHSGTGKTTAARYLANTYGFQVFEGSTILEEAAAAQGHALSTRQSYETFFRSQQQKTTLSWLADTVLRSECDRVVFSGLRSEYDLERIKQDGGTVIALCSPPEVCVARLDNHPKNPKTLEEYLEHQRLQESTDKYGSHVSLVVEQADYHIDTSHPLHSVYAALDGVVRMAIDTESANT